MMGLKTIYEYDYEIRKIDEILHSFEAYIKECPEDSGTKANYESLKYIRNELKKERDNLEFYKATQEALDRCDDSKKHTGTLQNMESMEAITATVDIHVLMNLTRVLNELIEIIESGKFDVIKDSKKKNPKNSIGDEKYVYTNRRPIKRATQRIKRFPQSALVSISRRTKGK